MSVFVTSRAALACALVTWLASVALDCQAQAIVIDGGVKFDQTESPSKLEYRDKNGIQRSDFDAARKIKVRVDDELVITVSVSHANSVLFKYSARDIVKIPTEDKVAADKLADAFAGFVDVLSSKTPATGKLNALRAQAENNDKPVVTKVLLDEIDLADLAKRIQWTSNTWNSASKTIDKLLDASGAVEAGRDADAWKRDLAEKDPSIGLGKLPALWLKSLQPTQTIRCAVEYSDESSKSCSGPRASLVANLTAVGVTNAQMYFDMITAINSERANILAQARDIKDLADAIKSDQTIVVKTVPHDQENNQELTIDVEGKSRFESLLSDSAKQYRSKRVGAYTITFAPYELVHVRPSLGAIYSFVKSPKFSAARNEAGELTINGDTDEYAEYGGLVAMDFVLDKYARKGIQPFFQVGVSPKSDSLGIAVGGGVRAYKSFTFSIGAVYQRVDKLAGELSIGDVIEEEGDLKTNKEFKLGFYIGVGVKLE